MQKERQSDQPLVIPFLTGTFALSALAPSKSVQFVCNKIHLVVDSENINSTAPQAPHSRGSVASSGGLPQSLMPRVFTLLYKTES